MKEREFHLFCEPWICVMGKDCRIRKVTLPEALFHAAEYRSLAGETESQNFAVLRFLLAVLHTVFTRKNENGEPQPIEKPREALRRWGEIWKAGRFPEQPVREYLEQWADRFWLFDPVYPFYQVPGIDGTKNPAKKLNGELVESSNKIQLFSMRSGKEKERLAYDEAARWLIHIQSFGDTAAKKPSPKLCWPGNLGIVMAKGSTLFETLMLNLTLLKDGKEPWGEAKPSWERAKPVSEKLKEVPVPDNQPELLTMQCRRVLLMREESAVVGFTEAAGEYMENESAFVEQMTFWAERKKEKDVTCFYPRRHEKTRQMWRDFSVFLGRDSIRPGIMSWTGRLQNAGMIPRDKVIAFQIIGIEYGSMFCGVTDEFSDSLSLHATLLGDLGRVWQQHIIDEVGRCENLAKAVGILASSLDKAAGGEGKEAGRLGKEQAYYRLDVPFRQWLLEIDPGKGLEEQIDRRRAWRETAVSIIRNLGQELVNQAGAEAFAGRTLKEKIKNKEMERHYSAPEAFQYFLFLIKKAYE